MKTSVIILAAGKGKRMGANKNKQFIEIMNKPILYYTIKAFENNDSIDEIVLVASKEEISYCKEQIVEKYSFKKVFKIIEGGKERQNSVLNGLKAMNDTNIVLIHDGARPFVSDDIINNCIKYANIYGATACGVLPKDTIKVRDDSSFSLSTPKRENLFAVQTPQGFKYDLILQCHKKVENENKIVTDDTMVVESYGNKVYLYDGSYNNIKITTPEDLIMAEKLINTLK